MLSEDGVPFLFLGRNMMINSITNKIPSAADMPDNLWEAIRSMEEEAHRYIQRSSMDTGTNMVETAQMVLTMMR